MCDSGIFDPVYANTNIKAMTNDEVKILDTEESFWVQAITVSKTKEGNKEYRVRMCSSKDLQDDGLHRIIWLKYLYFVSRGNP